jgi:P22 coat protein - gene protein 5.
MATFPSNILQTVQTYQRSSLALLYNLCCHLSTANMKFKDFDKIQANLGSTVTFDLPPRATTTAGLVASFQAAVQRVQSLTADQANNSSFAVTAQQRIFNLEKGEEDYMRVFGKSFIAELANLVEGNIAQNWDSSVMSQLDNTLNTFSGPYRFFGNGATAISSFNQLAQMHMLFKNYGAVAEGMKVYLPDTVVPSVVGNGINQFVPKRNDDIAMSWEIGDWGTPVVKYYQSNLMPIHVSGTTGTGAQTLTVISTNDPTGQNVTQITVSGATASDANAVFSGDVFQFADGVSGQPNMRYLTFIGHKPSANPVQVRATANAAADGSGHVVLSITPALNWAGGQNQNLNNPIAAGMQLLTFPSHRCGGVLGGDAFYVAMPQLPEQDPYPTANENDPSTGASLRLTYGSLFGQNQTGMIYDEVHGSVIVPEYSLRLLVPLSQG